VSVPGEQTPETTRCGDGHEAGDEHLGQRARDEFDDEERWERLMTLIDDTIDDEIDDTIDDTPAEHGERGATDGARLRSTDEHTASPGSPGSPGSTTTWVTTVATSLGAAASTPAFNRLLYSDC